MVRRREIPAEDDPIEQRRLAQDDASREPTIDELRFPQQDGSGAHSDVGRLIEEVQEDFPYIEDNQEITMQEPSPRLRQDSPMGRVSSPWLYEGRSSTRDYDDRSPRSASRSTRHDGDGTPDSFITMMKSLAEQNSAQMRLFAEQSARQAEMHQMLIAQLAERSTLAPRKEYERPPNYNCKVLDKDATPIQVDDWIKAVEAANSLRPTSTIQQRIEWSLSRLGSEKQTEWRHHVAGLEKGEPEWEDLISFVKRQHVDPALQERYTRDQLMRIRMEREESPLHYYARWRALHDSLGTLNIDDDATLGHQYWYKLPTQIKKELDKMTVNFKSAKDIAHKAERIGLYFGDDAQFQKRKQSNFPEERPSKYASQLWKHGQRSAQSQQSSSSQKKNFLSHTRKENQSRDASPNSQRSHGSGNSTTKCFACGDWGHISPKCPKRNANHTGLSRPQGQTQQGARVQEVYAPERSFAERSGDESQYSEN
ncbi:hypothetical protein SNK04_005396 [Fusarium graminearum]